MYSITVSPDVDEASATPNICRNFSARVGVVSDSNDSLLAQRLRPTNFCRENLATLTPKERQTSRRSSHNLSDRPCVVGFQNRQTRSLPSGRLVSREQAYLFVLAKSLPCTRAEPCCAKYILSRACLLRIRRATHRRCFYAAARHHGVFVTYPTAKISRALRVVRFSLDKRK